MNAEQEALVLGNLRSVVIIAQGALRKLPRHICLGDLVSDGSLGLITAATKYDPERGAFKTFAEPWIRGAILDGLRSRDNAGRLLRKRERALKIARRKLGDEATEAEVALAAGMTEKQAAHVREEIEVRRYHSLECLWLDDGEEWRALSAAEPSSRRPGPEAAAELNERERIVWSLVDRLPPRERLVVRLYYQDGMLQREIGKVLGVNEPRICHLRTKALERLRRMLTGVKVAA